ncbi:hypothetical protein QQS21_001653 [Conoideocrella luteorostrata]|uniref:NAD-dependent epimerase/dehydratase domain-containing protein n=1 Tax=Conoideocrella luteorostrata TaxID=1105319 RepID=A0AAJ0G1Y4_9HYPO|nr:hypothetical protein QQS21_001653 [Conoideocrella luteorostrata]
MEIIIVGATGYIGSTVLEQCLSHPEITKIHILTRRPLSNDQTSSAGRDKISITLKTNWLEYDDSLLHQLKEARACIWCIGGRHTQNTRWATPEEYLQVTVDYTVAATRCFVRMMSLTGCQAGDAAFRFVYCSGDSSELVYNRSLWIMGPTRRAKGCAEKNIFDIADSSHGAVESITVRPCGVFPKRHTLWTWFLTTMVLPTLAVEELAASMVELALRGSRTGRIVRHKDAEKLGREVMGRSIE